MRLSFSEQPEGSLSAIRVLDPDGAAVQSRTAEAAAAEPLTLVVPLRPLRRGVYTVSWKVVSAVDGHASEGTYAFGVRASPERAGEGTSATATSSSSRLELVARWVFLLGVAALLGGSVAAVARFGGSSGSDLVLARGGGAAAVAGLLLLAEAQRRAAGSSLAGLLDTSVGRALIWRAVALAVAAAALLLAGRHHGTRRGLLAAAAAAALLAIVVHAAAGHAAAGSESSIASVAAQSAHFAAAGVWLGGLAALLLGVRGASSAATAAAVRRFSGLAFAVLVVVLVTGTVRAIEALSSWRELLDTGYGLAVSAKALLILLIAGLAARNRTRGVPAAARDLRPLRRTSGAELALAVAALGAAGLLGTLAPPVSGSPTAPATLSASGADFGTTTRVELEAASDQPGPNRFTARVEDYDSGNPLRAEGVRLRFTPLEDPGVEPSSLTLSRGEEDSYVGSGANLAFDGRWGVNVLVLRGRRTVEVPLELDLPGPEQFVSVLRIRDRPPKYTVQIGSIGYIQFEPRPERAGPSKIYVGCYTPFGSASRVDRFVLTVARPGGPAQQRPVRRLGTGRFVADVELEAGEVEIAAVARTRDGTRLRGVLPLDVPAD